MKIIKVPKDVNIFFVGDIHEQEYHFNKLLEKINPCSKTWIVSLGDIFDKGNGFKAACCILQKLKDLNEEGVGFLIKGNHELKTIKHLENNGETLSSLLYWVKTQPLSICFEFENKTRVIALHGGVTPSMTLENLINDIKICYVRDIDDKGKPIPVIKEEINGEVIYKPKRPGKSWHHYYDGRFGYIVSGHEPLYDGKPKFYNYSCNLDTACFKTKILTAQEFTGLGLKGKLLTITKDA